MLELFRSTIRYIISLLRLKLLKRLFKFIKIYEIQWCTRTVKTIYTTKNCLKKKLFKSNSYAISYNFRKYIRSSFFIPKRRSLVICIIIYKLRAHYVNIFFNKRKCGYNLINWYALRIIRENFTLGDGPFVPWSV